MSKQPEIRPASSVSSAVSRRGFCAATAGAIASPLLARLTFAEQSSGFSLRYILGTCMYGYTDLGEILPEVRRTGAAAIDNLISRVLAMMEVPHYPQRFSRITASLSP